MKKHLSVSIKTSITIIFILLINVASAQSVSVKAVDSLIQKGETKQVIPYLEKQLAKQPENEELLRLLGFHNIQRNNLQLGEKYYRDALKINSKCARCYLNIGKIYGLQNKHKIAAEYIEKAIAADPADAFIFAARAQYKQMQGDVSGALSDYNKAISLSPETANYYIERGLYNARKGNFTLALNDLNKAIALEPRNLIPYLNRSAIFYELENLDASCSDYQTAKRLMETQNITDPELRQRITDELEDFCNPEKANYYYQRGIACYNLKKYDEAIEFYNQGLKKFPGHALMLSFKGNALMLKRNYETALVNYQLSLDNRANLRVEAIQNQKLKDAGKAELENFYQATLASVYFSIAECHLNLATNQEALFAINQALSILPKTSGLDEETYYNLRGNVYIALTKYELALADFDKSIETNKNYAFAYVNRAIAKAGTVEKIKTTTYTLAGKFSKQPLQLTFSNKSVQKKYNSEINSALADCDMAIKLDQQLGFAYYIRGQLKQFDNQKDYCLDLLTAKKLGQVVSAASLAGCKN